MLTMIQEEMRHMWMKKISLGGYTISCGDNIIQFYDVKESRVCYVTNIYDEVHLVIEADKGTLIFYPRYDIQISQIDERHFHIDEVTDAFILPNLS